MLKLKKVIKFLIKLLITMIVLLFLLLLSWRYYPYVYMTFMPLKKVQIGIEEYSFDKKFKAVYYQIPRFLFDSNFVRLTNVKTSKVIANIELDEDLYYVFKDNKFCLGHALGYRVDWLYRNVLIEDIDKLCVDLN